MSLHFPTEPIMSDPSGSQPPFQLPTLQNPFPSSTPAAATPTSSSGSGFTFSWPDFWRTLEAGVLGGVAGGLQNPGGGAAAATGAAAVNPNYFQDLWSSDQSSLINIAAIVLGIFLIALAIWAVLKP